MFISQFTIIQSLLYFGYFGCYVCDQLFFSVPKTFNFFEDCRSFNSQDLTSYTFAFTFKALDILCWDNCKLLELSTFMVGLFPSVTVATLLKTEAGSMPEGKVKIKLEHDGTVLDVDEDDVEKVRLPA